MPRSRTVPSYRLHKPSGQAVVTLRTAEGGRRDVYLGVYNSPESRAEYGRLIAEQATAPLTANVATPAARESEPVGPVDPAVVDATFRRARDDERRPHASRVGHAHGR